MLLYFGERWDAPLLDEGARQVETPVGQPCLAECGDLIQEGDRGLIRAVMVKAETGGWVSEQRPVHAECDMLPIVGHMHGVCSCTGHSHDRAAAKLCWQRVGEARGRPLEELAAP